MDNKRDSDPHLSKKNFIQPDCQKSKGWYVHKTLKQTSNDLINQQDRYTKFYIPKHVITIEKTKLMHHRLTFWSL